MPNYYTYGNVMAPEDYFSGQSPLRFADGGATSATVTGAAGTPPLSTGSSATTPPLSSVAGDTGTDTGAIDWQKLLDEAKLKNEQATRTLPTYDLGRKQLTPDVDYATYGFGPEQKFFSYDTKYTPGAPEPSVTGGLPNVTGSAGGGGGSNAAAILGMLARTPMGQNLIKTAGSKLTDALGLGKTGLAALTPAQLATMPKNVLLDMGVDPQVLASIDAASAGAGAVGAGATGALGAASAGADSALSALTPEQLVQLPENELMKMGLDPKVVQSIKADSLAGKVVPGAQTALGLYTMYKGIEQGKAGQAALGGYGAGAGIASLTGAGSGLAPVLGLNPIGLGIAAIAALGSTFVKKGEMGEIPLRNYWRAVDQGRDFGMAPPAELAEGFINFYRTSKNNFPGLQKYGKNGNEDFIYDMTQVINNGVKEGTIKEGATAQDIFQSTVKPWLDSMGSGPSHPDAKRVEDFMMTDLIHNFMQGKPISNAQVKGDSKFKIVSQRPVYAGVLPDFMKAPPPAATDEESPLQKADRIPDEFNFAKGGLSYHDGEMTGGLIGYAKGGKPDRYVEGPGSGRDDKIPALLSDGEYVMDAETLALLGDGSTKEGAKRMDSFRAKIRQHKGRALSRGRISPNAKSPEKYMGGGLS